MLAFLESALRVLEVALGIGFVIFVHELGHFLVAKRVGIRVETFSLGFGPRLLGVRRGDTDYRLSLVPLGGYVKMAGEDPDQPGSGAADEFGAKSVGARSAVIVAGVIMNTIFAVIAFILAFRLGVVMDAPAVGAVMPGSAAEAAGLRYGDRIRAIDGERPIDFMDIGLAAAYASGPLQVTYERPGESARTVTVTPRRMGGPVQQLGFQKPYVVHTVSASAAPDLAPGDWILAVDGRPVKEVEDVQRAVHDAPGRPLGLTTLRGDTLRAVTLTPLPQQVYTYGFTVATSPVVVADVKKGMAAAEAGLLAGDVITSIGGLPAEQGSFTQRVSETPTGSALTLVIERGDEAAPRTVTLTPRLDPASGRRLIGISFGCGVIGSVAPGSPAEAAGLRPGDRLRSAADAPIGTDPDYFARDACSPDRRKEPLTLTLRRRGEAKPVTAKLTPVPVEGKLYGEAGLSWTTATFVAQANGIVEPLRMGVQRTVIFMEQVFLTFSGMFAMRIDPSTLGGPIGIATAAFAVSETGITKLVYFLAIISVNLAVLNILPIPLLDGGHLVFLAIEKVKGSPASPAIQAGAQWVGLVFLLGLMIFATTNDIRRVIFG